jgi:hypothetical protein
MAEETQKGLTSYPAYVRMATVIPITAGESNMPSSAHTNQPSGFEKGFLPGKGA